MKIGRMCLVGILTAILIGSFLVDTVCAAQTLPPIWDWMRVFKVTLTQKEYQFDSQGVAPSPGKQVKSSIPGYMVVNHAQWGSCCPEYQRMWGILYTKNSSGKWDPNSFVELQFDFFAGSGTKWVATNVYTDGNLQFQGTVLFSGKLDKTGHLASGTMQTLGCSSTEIVSGSTERMAGTLILSGRIINYSQLPPEILAVSVGSFHETIETNPEGGIIYKYNLLPEP